jgi:hypothetical protein
MYRAPTDGRYAQLGNVDGAVRTDSRLLHGDGPGGARARPFPSTKNLRRCHAKSSIGHSVGCDVADRVAQPGENRIVPLLNGRLKCVDADVNDFADGHLGPSWFRVPYASEYGDRHVDSSGRSLPQAGLGPTGSEIFP